MKEQIGEAAGKIWNTLGKKGEISVAMLPKQLKEKSELVLEALGWLAHENKINFVSKSGKSFVALTDPEQEIFRTIN